MMLGRSTDWRTGWQPWFAWYPVKLFTGEWVWLEDVERANWFLTDIQSVQEAMRFGHIGFSYVYRPLAPTPALRGE